MTGFSFQQLKSSLQFRLDKLKVFNMSEISEDKAIAESKKILIHYLIQMILRNRRQKDYEKITL